MTTSGLSMQQQTEWVATLREEAASLKAVLAERQAIWEAENATLLSDYKAKKDLLEGAEGDLRATACLAFTDGALAGNKAPFPGIGIRVQAKLSYEPSTAFDWAKEHGIALSLDKSAFEALARTSIDRTLAFVGRYQEVTATIATDLRKALAEAPEEATQPTEV